VALPMFVQAEPATKDVVARGLVTYLDSNPNSSIAKYLGVYLVGQDNLDGALMGSAYLNNESNESPVYQLAFRINNGLETMVEGYWKGDLPTTASTTDYWCNDRGNDVFVEKAFYNISGTVSTTVSFYMATSTENGLALYTTAPFSTIIDAVSMVTSTLNPTYNSYADAGTNGTQLTRVADGECVVTQQLVTNNNGCDGSVCEAVTSTNRGWTGEWGFKYRYVMDL